MSAQAAHAAHDNRVARRAWRRAIVATILTLTYGAASVALAPGSFHLVVQIEIALIGAIVVLTALGALRRAAPLPPPSPFDRLARPSAPTALPLPLDLVRITRRIAAAEASAADARRHLGPLAASIAYDRLRRRSHKPLDPDSLYDQLPRPVPAALALLVDPAFADGDARDRPGLDADGIESLVRALEEL